MPNAPQHEPSLASALEQAIASAIGSMHTSIPGQIERYDYQTAKADVKPLLARRYADGTIIELPVITNVPVVWPRCSLGSVTFPLVAGDGVLLVFSERSMDEWLSKGGAVAPADLRKYDLSDAIAIPGLYSFATQTKIANNDDFQIVYKDASIFIRKNGDIELDGGNKILIKANGDIEVGEGALQKILNGETFRALFDAHTHTGGFVSPTSPPVITAAIFDTTSPIKTLSSKVKAAT